MAGALIGTYISYKIAHRNGAEANFELGPGLVNGTPGAKISLKL